MIVILDNLRSALNVGSILRTCDALGITEVYLCGITPSITDNKVRKTSLGAENNIKITDCPSTFDCLSVLKSKGYQIIGLELTENSINIKKVKVAPKSALVVGNEVSGLNEETLSLCDVVTEIPMSGIKESLNVSVAFGIAAYEMTK